MKNEKLKKILNSKFENRQTKFVRATSLIEVIVVLAIVSMTLIAAMNLVIRASSSIKDSEIQDSAHGVLLKAIEATKSQEDIKISSDFLIGNMANNTPYNFSLQVVSSSSKILKYQSTDAMTTCTSSSPYYVTGINFIACLMVQMELHPQTSTHPKYYEVIARIKYVSGRNPNVLTEETLNTYRYFDFVN